MYTLYHYPSNASMAPHIMLCHLGLPFELVNVDRNSDAQKSAEYLAINPTGRIPALRHGGKTIFESAAICMYIAEQAGHGVLRPEVADEDRGEFLQWLMYLTNTLQAELMLYFYPSQHGISELNEGELKKAQEKRLADVLDILDKQIAGHNFLVSDKLTVCDFYLVMLCYWCRNLETPPQRFRHLSRLLSSMVSIPSVIDVEQKEGLDFNCFRFEL